MTIAHWMLVAAAVLLALPVCTFFVQVVFALTHAKQSQLLAAQRPSVVILMPAHNEATVLGECLASIVPQLNDGDRLLLVADNCTDNTAAIAKAAGVEVIERIDPDHRGKGYALEFGLNYLRTCPPKVVIIIDSDCQAGDGLVDTLARFALEYRRPIQSLYLMTAPKGSGLRLRMAEFAWIVKNQVRPMGMASLGMPCQLMGTGMAFPWNLLDTISLASGHIVEDMKLGIDLALRGYPPMFCSDARVTSRFPESKEGIQSQRTRWEHGHLGMIVAAFPNLVTQSLVRLDLPLMALALDLMIPPVALLLILVSFLLCFGLVLLLAGGPFLPLLLSAVLQCSLLLSVLLAWHRFGRGAVSLADLTYAPLYALGKVPLYVKFWTGKQQEWVRSKRDKD